MTIHHRHLTRALMIAALAAGAWTATEMADHSAAHADTTPPAVQEPGGVLGDAVKLPAQASERAKDVVATVTDPASKPGKGKPKNKPKHGEDQGGTQPREDPTPSADEPVEDEPAPVEDKPRDDPAPPVVDLPPAELPPVIVDPAPVEVPPLPIEVPPLPAPPVELPPAPATQPVPAAVTHIIQAVAPLPVAADPIPAPPPAGAVAQLIADLTAGTDPAADCADSPDDARRIGRDALRRLLAGLEHEPPPAVAKKPAAPGCPGTPDRGTLGGVQVKPPPPSAADMVVGDLARSHVAPVLGRLEHARARSTIPASRHVAMEPGPA